MYYNVTSNLALWIKYPNEISKWNIQMKYLNGTPRLMNLNGTPRLMNLNEISKWNIQMEYLNGTP